MTIYQAFIIKRLHLEDYLNIFINKFKRYVLTDNYKDNSRRRGI